MKVLILIPALALICACEKDTDPLTPTERNLVGSWLYDEVTRKEGFFKQEDLTAEYDDYRLTFEDDFTLKMMNLSTSETFTGVWEVNYVQVTVNTETSGQFQLVASLWSDLTGEVVQIFWEQISVGGTTILARADGIVFRLRKI